MKRLLLALALALSLTAPAAAQNTQCANRPTGDSTNACANTRFVMTATAPLVVGTTPITGGTSTGILYNNAGVLGNAASVTTNGTNFNVAGYLRVGSTSAPTNTTAGDLTATRLSIGNGALGATGEAVIVGVTTTATAGSDAAVGVTATLNPATASSAAFRTLFMSATLNSAQNFTGSGINGISSGYFENRVVNAGTITALNGITAFGLFMSGTAASMGTVTTANGGLFQSVNSFSNSLTSTIANAHGVHVINPTNSGSGPLTITSQAGVTIEALSAATNNTHVLLGTSSIPSGNWGIYASTTSPNYFAGSVGIGTTSVTAAGSPSLRSGRSKTGATTYNDILIDGTIASDVTSTARMFATSVSTQAASFTLGTFQHFAALQSTIGAGSTVTNQYGFAATSTLTGATNNYGFYGDIAAAANRWNFYAAGTARNYMAGALSIGTTSDPGTGGLYVNGAVTTNSTVAPGNAANFYLGASGGNGVINWDANDYSTYDKTSNQYQWYIGSSQIMSLDTTSLAITGAMSTSTYASVGTKIRAAGSAPTISAGCNGAGSSISGSDLAGLVTGQTAAATTCTITFNSAYAAAPYCVASGQTSPLTGAITSTTTTLVVNFASTANYQFTYNCIARSGG